MMALHIPEENRCLDIMELIEQYDMLKYALREVFFIRLLVIDFDFNLSVITLGLRSYKLYLRIVFLFSRSRLKRVKWEIDERIEE